MSDKPISDDMPSDAGPARNNDDDTDNRQVDNNNNSPGGNDPNDGDDDDSNNNELDVRRDVVGKAVVRASDAINDNLVVARFVAGAVIAALTAYGVSRTPLFFRYRTVAELPANAFRRRRKLRGRLMRVVENHNDGGGNGGSAAKNNHNNSHQPIRVRVRQLSPLERILPKNAFETLLSWHPSAAIGIRPEDNPRETLHVEIAGIRTTDHYRNASGEDGPGEWLRRLAADHAVVTMQFLGRRVVFPRSSSAYDGGDNDNTAADTGKRQIPGLSSSSTEIDGDATQIAVARLYHRTEPTQFFPTDVAQSMIRWGRAEIAADGLYGGGTTASSDTTTKERMMDATDDVKQLQADARYMEGLAKAEYDAARESRGMWADPSIRRKRRDVVSEVEFQETAAWWQKLWRRLRGG